jgi:hypothetical protein
MYIILKCHNIAETHNFTRYCRVFQEELYNGIPNVTVWRMTMCWTMDGLYGSKCKRFRYTRHKVTFAIVKLLFKHPVFH